ncbi:serine hydrolase domain-containing protein [Roseobacter sp. HKCCA0434]|uniref:serine hydrolase domain-containing protein n=1 Tax=Roseobacter sp. HKCCA0434 TaxID=3079297 RepID=UPI002905E131|nr:serine hydrolase domain-containing protein [Roseobacter sp. HKCCA0434]
MPAFTCHIGPDGVVTGQGAGAIMPWWSVTKTVIAALALRLEAAGQLDLDDGDPSLEALLRHEGGLPDYGGLAHYHEAVARGDEPWSRDRFLAEVGGPIFAPGASWAYSNIGYGLAVERIEAATGLTLADLIEAEICAPLGLAARLADTPEDMAEVAVPTGGYHPGWVFHRCLIGPVQDAARLVHALATGRLVRPDALARMTDARVLGPGIAGRPWTSHGYGIGLMMGEIEGRACFGHSAGGPFSGGAVYHAPETKETAAAFCDGPGEIRSEWLVAGMLGAVPAP